MAIISSRAHAELFDTIDAVTAVDLETFGFTADEVKITDYAHITALDGNVYYTYGGVTPTTTSGHVLSSGGQIVLQGRVNIKQFKMISKSGTVNLVITLSTN